MTFLKRFFDITHLGYAARGQRKLEAEIRKLQAETKLTELALASEVEKFSLRDNATGLYHFNDGVDAASVAHCMHYVSKMIKVTPGQPIEIIFNSPGGSVLDGLELYDWILARRVEGAPIDTTILGVAASMAGVLSQAGRIRRMGPYAHLMIHEIASFNFGKLSSLKDQAKFNERLYDRLVDILAGRSTLTADDIKARAERRDWWLDASEAKELGFVDVVLPSPTL